MAAMLFILGGVMGVFAGGISSALFNATLGQAFALYLVISLGSVFLGLSLSIVSSWLRTDVDRRAAKAV